MTHRQSPPRKTPLALVALIAGAMALVGCDPSSGTDAGMGGGTAGGRTTGGGSAAGGSAAGGSAAGGSAAGGSAGGSSAGGSAAGGTAGGMVDAGTPDCAHSVPTSVAGFTTINFSATGTMLTGFAGAEDSQIVGDPECGAASLNKVMQVGRGPASLVYAGTTVATLAGNQVPRIVFSAGNTIMTMRTRSAVTGIKVRLKVEDAADMSKSVETEATTTVANAWETLTFDFSRRRAPRPSTTPPRTTSSPSSSTSARPARWRTHARTTPMTSRSSVAA